MFPSHSPSAISWIGSIQGFLLLTVSAFTGPIFDAGYNRTLLSLGSSLLVLGLMMTSLVKQYYQAFLAQGVCFGIGAGMIFIPSLAIVSTYFHRHRALAVGITAAGSSLGEQSPPSRLSSQLLITIQAASSTRHCFILCSRGSALVGRPEPSDSSP